ncbi:MAG: DUF2828 family protein [Lachnospiraceae bacterium]|nr:DUF2828 family protein [Lachnospiraceae bacterium]
MRRAARFDNKDIQKELRDIDTTQTHAVHFLKNYNNRSVTENGAIGYRTTGHPLLDLNFKVSSLRNRGEQDIVHDFIAAFYQDRKYAVKWLFFVRDILEGLGERRTFRVCMKYLAVSQPQIALAVMKLIPEYGRYDDLLVYLDTPLCEEACAFIGEQLKQDRIAMAEKQPVSLLAKWLPGNNTSSAESRRYAHVIAKQLRMSAKQYRKTLSALRSYLQVVETRMSASEWEQVEYERVPAKAQLKYDKAFARHDAERRLEYLKEVYLGEGKLNAKGLMPYEIVHRAMAKSHPYTYGALEEDLLAELMWQKLSEEGFQNDWGLEDCIVVADGSGSMYTHVSGNSTFQAIEVCNSLAIYFAGLLKGVFRDKAITFSGNPQFIDLAPGKSLKEKLEIMLAHCEVANTNIEAVFDMLLAMAVSNQVPAEELPKQVLLISDMEFDMATCPDWRWRGQSGTWKRFDQTLFQHIEEKYKQAGYTMPRLIFWNVCGRSDTIPMVNNESGLCLLSGFSQNAIKVAGDRYITDPYQSLIKVLDSPRYDKVEKALHIA